MRTKIKAVIAALVSVLMIFSCFSVAFASEEKVTPVIVVSGMSAEPLCNADTGEEVFPPSARVIALGVLEAIFPTLETLISLKGDSFEKYGADAIHSLFEQIACDTDGNSVNNVVAKSYPKTVDNYWDINTSKTKNNEGGAVLSIARKIGAKNVYFFNYDWRLSPIDLAEDLNVMVENVKKEHNCDKVSFFAMSMGGTISNAYIAKYGSESIRNIVYATSAFLGVDIVDQLLTGDISMETVSILSYIASSVRAGQSYDVASAVMDILTEAAKNNAMKSADDYLKKLVKELRDSIYTKVFNNAFITFPGIWGLLSADKFDEAVEVMTSYVPLSHSFIAKAREYSEIQKKIPELLKSAKEDGTNVYIIGAYGYSGIPVTTAGYGYTDTLIDTYHMSGKCAVAPYGKTLADVGEYSLEGACGEKNHSHISADNVIDASAGLFPDHTWFIKNMKHVEFSTAHETSSLAVYVVTSEDPINVYSDSRYPQFTELNRETGKLTSLTNGVVIPDSEETETDSSSSILKKLVNLLKVLMKYVKLFISKGVV